MMYVNVTAVFVYEGIYKTLKGGNLCISLSLVSYFSKQGTCAASSELKGTPLKIPEERRNLMSEKTNRIYTRVSDKDKTKIERIAKSCNLPVSEYVRQRALGYEPQAVLPDAFYKFYGKLCEILNLPFDNELKEKALTLFDEIHNAFLTDKKQRTSEIRKEVKNWQQQDSGP